MGFLPANWHFPNLHLKFKPWLPWLTIGPLMLTVVSTGGWYSYQQHQQNQALNQQANAYLEQSDELSRNLTELATRNSQLETELASVSAELLALQNVDQKLRNDELEATIAVIITSSPKIKVSNIKL